jgi:hypothetical protein
LDKFVVGIIMRTTRRRVRLVVCRLKVRITFKNLGSKYEKKWQFWIHRDKFG